MIICNMSIEMGVWGGMIVLDDIIFEYIKGWEFVFKGVDFDIVIECWFLLYMDEDVIFDQEYYFLAEDIEFMIIYGINLGMGIGISQVVFEVFVGNVIFENFLKYMGL